MRSFQERRKWRKIVFSKPALLILFLIFLYASSSAGRTAYQAWQVSKESEKIREAREELLEKERVLDSKIESLESPSGLEKEAKERFNVKSPGEKVLIIVNPPGQNSTSSDSRSGPFIDFLKDFFKR